MSAVLVSLSQGGAYLSAGDAEAKDEMPIARWVRHELKNEIPSPMILKLSHHGSKHSSSIDFLRAIRPSEAWISAGFGNSYGHPHPETLERIKRLGIPLRRTDLEGAILEKQPPAIDNKNITRHP